MKRMTAVTERGLSRLSAGASMNLSGSDLFSIDREEDGWRHVSVYAKGDRGTDPLVMFASDEDDPLLPSELRHYRQPALERALSFVQRASNLPISLPSGWHQNKHDNLVAFFSLPTRQQEAFRWIVEVRPNDSRDTIFWEVTTTSDRRQLETFTRADGVHLASRNAWARDFVSALQALGEISTPNAEVDVDVELGAAEPMSPGHTRSYEEWVPALTDQQRRFLEVPTDRSVRLRGPAGSGKTLTLALKGVHEIKRAREAGAQLSVLFVTHSWSLAGDVDALVTLLAGEPMGELTTLPLVAVAQQVLPSGMLAEGLSLIGDDSLTGKRVQLSQIEEVLNEFLEGDWVTYRSGASNSFRERIDAVGGADDDRSLAWDCLIEFGCVLGADGIFPSVNALSRYLKLPRAPWMMKLESEGDRRVVYALYQAFWRALQERSLITPDQLLNDFINYLETFAWNHRRTTEGYDLVIADEFHLFNVQERQTLRYLSRRVDEYPRILMAVDPRQAPWQIVVGQGFSGSSNDVGVDSEIDNVETVDMPTVHRFTPQILAFVKHIHLDFPNLDLGADWDLAVGELESSASKGPLPTLFVSDTRADEESSLYRAMKELYPRGHAGARMALAVVDEDLFTHYLDLAQRAAQSGGFRIIPITSREDVGMTKGQRRGIVVGPAEYLAGLQFDIVLVAGLPDMTSNLANQSYRRRRFLSLLYLAVTRASKEIRIFVNHDHGGIPDVISKAVDKGRVGRYKP